jgi:hypothetical protein
MSKANFETFVDEQITRSARSLADQKSSRLDNVGFGKLGFYLALRRVLNGETTDEDLGLMDAINDSLQALEVLEKDETFLGSIAE